MLQEMNSKTTRKSRLAYLRNVVYNNHGKFFCFVVESNKELPQLFVYDVRASFPQFNKYWEHHINQKASM